jgi:hypothetical protein
MTPAARAVTLLATSLGAVPLAWLAYLRRRVDAAYWWLAAALGLSFVVDLAGQFLTPSPRWVLSLVFPVATSGLIGAVLLARVDALRFLIMLVATGCVAALWHDGTGPDILLPTVAWLTVTGIAWQWPALGMLRLSLLVMFGGGWLAWLGYNLWPGWPSYLVFQATRLVGTVLFCRAASFPSPRLRAVS